MTNFYTMTRDKDPAGGAIVAADHDDRVYFYVANTQLWHHSPLLEVQLDTNDGDWTTTEVPVVVVPALVAGVGRMDDRGYSGSRLRELMQQPAGDIRTTAELGVPTSIPTRDDPAQLPEGLSDVLRSLPLGESRIVARFVPRPGDKRDAARALADAITVGSEPSLMGIPLIGQVRREQEAELVEVTRATAEFRSVNGRPRRDLRQGHLINRRIFSLVPDEELVTLAAQTCGTSLDGIDMNLSMLVLSEVERRDLMADVIAHRAEVFHRENHELSRAEAACETAARFRSWREQFYLPAIVPLPREAWRAAATVAWYAEGHVPEWPAVGDPHRAVILDGVLDELGTVGEENVDLERVDEVMHRLVKDYLEGTDHAAVLERVREDQRRRDAGEPGPFGAGPR